MQEAPLALTIVDGTHQAGCCGWKFQPQQLPHPRQPSGLVPSMPS
jgi:hypothetical protein